MPLVLLAHVPVIYVTDPTEDWCGVIDAALGGDIVMLEAGDYEGPCEIDAKASDLPGEQTIVQSLDPLAPAVLRPAPGADLVLDVHGDRLVLLELVLAGAVRARDLTELAVRGVRFVDSAVGLQQTGPIRELFVTDSEATDVARPLQLGAGTFALDNVLLIGADEAITVGAGAAGTVSDAVVTATAGAALHVEEGAEVRVERSLLEGAVAIEGGDVAMHSNIVLGGVTAAGAGVELFGNTLLGPLNIDPQVHLIDNAFDREGPEGGGGNVACVDLDACFVDAGAWDFYPAPDSPLRTSGVPAPDLTFDWCRRVRASPPTAGAIEAYGEASIGPIDVTFKHLVDCGLPEAPEEPPPLDPTVPAVPEPADRACGCTSRGGAGGSWAILLALGVLRRISGRSGRLSRSGPGSPGEECVRT